MGRQRVQDLIPDTPWDCHICRSGQGWFQGGQLIGIYGSPMEFLGIDLVRHRDSSRVMFQQALFIRFRDSSKSRYHVHMPYRFDLKPPSPKSRAEKGDDPCPSSSCALNDFSKCSCFPFRPKTLAWGVRVRCLDLDGGG